VDGLPVPRATQRDPVFDLGGSHARVSNTQVIVLAFLVSVVGNDTAAVGSTTMGLLLAGGLLAVTARRFQC
jgi:hypothetical protein